MDDDDARVALEIVQVESEYRLDLMHQHRRDDPGVMNLYSGHSML
ncbi:MAG TPA: hypothetical protein VN841_11120 [Bryobacteraceae bacterium]|nr:hypothetical protein [Bryobacteraceae bacterium]